MMPEAPGAHWATLVADGIVIASGYCWCDRSEGGKHTIGARPTYKPTDTKVSA